MAFAQDDDHKVEITGDYSFVHAVPQNNNIIPSFNLNGGGGSVAFYFSKYIGIEGDLQGYGRAHSNFYGNLYRDCTIFGCFVAGKSPSNNAFDFIIGGGIDIPVGEHIAIRPAQFDYLLTRFGNDFTHGNNNQSNFRYQAGVQFRF
jgi:hypothetical protein